MISDRGPSYQPVVVAHAALLCLGICALFVGMITAEPGFYLIAGPSLLLSGVAILLGSRITFQGPVGEVLRAVLGPARVRRVNTRALIWMALGIAICLWGIDGLRARHDGEHLLQNPLLGAERSH